MRLRCFIPWLSYKPDTMQFRSIIIFLNPSPVFNNGRDSCVFLSSVGSAKADWI